MMRPEEELDDLRIYLAKARRDCDMRAAIVITERIDHLIRNQPKEFQ